MAADVIHRRLLRPAAALPPPVAVLALLLLAWIPAPAPAAVSNCSLTGSTCVWSGCRTVTASDGSQATVCTAGTTSVPQGAVVDPSTSCWRYANTYTCYSTAQTNSCTSAKIQGCNLANSACSKRAAGGACVAYDQTWICPSRATTACSPSVPGGDCAIASDQCGKTLYGTCVSDTRTYTCTGATNTSCTGAAPGTRGCVKLTDTCTAWIGGICTKRTATYACPGKIVNCVTDPSCALASNTCLSKANGLCTSLQQNYTCTKTGHTQCLQTETTNACTGIATYGFQNQTAKAGDHGFARALQYHALLEAIKKNVSGNPPSIFNGRADTCYDTIGCALGNCCCDENVGEGGALIWSCSKEEAQLAASRRAQAAHFLASGCSVGFSFFGACACFQHEEWYCAFPSQLARLVQEQGREQLAAMAANGFGGATSTPVPAFPYYAPAGAGRWLGPYLANGNAVRIWQWSPACSGAVADIPPGTVCPSSASLWFAVCDGAACPAPAAAPTIAPAPAGISMLKVDTANAASQALTRYVVATGACKPPPSGSTGAASCSYTLSAWPGGNGGTALVRADVSWALFGPIGTGWSAPVYIGNDAFQGAQLGLNAAPAMGGGAPVSATLRYSTDRGASWRTAQLPLSIPATSLYTLPGTNLQVFGQCQGPYYQCDYQAVVPLTAVAKPWILNFNQQCGGSTLQADCSGFSLGQFALLDLGKMNLAAWAKSLVAEEPPAGTMAQQATASAKTMKGTLSGVQSLTGTNTQIQNGVPPPASGGNTPVSGGVPAAPVALNRTQCEADRIANTCEIVLTAAGNWPDDSGCGPAASGTTAGSAFGIVMAGGGAGGASCPHNVTELTIAWGDGTSSALAGPAPGAPPAFHASHRYASAGVYRIHAIFTLADGSTHTADARVQAWNGTPPPNQQNQAGYGGANPILP